MTHLLKTDSEIWMMIMYVRMYCIVQYCICNFIVFVFVLYVYLYVYLYVCVCIVLYVLHCIALHCVALRCIALHCMHNVSTYVCI